MNEQMIIDCFAGGGGASVGIEMALGRPVDIAINHDPEAIRMHKVNHPDTLHLTEDIFAVNLRKYVAGNHVALMWASPDCTSHSKAKGGQPRNSGLRILPWAVYKHAKAILPDVVIMENVEEIQQWGPLDERGYPIKERRGEDYEKFIGAMRSLGYIFDSRELVAADYGAPTTRKRWYGIFRRDGKDIVWPKPTHSKDGSGGLKQWIPVHTVLDFSDLGRSIFGRKKPLAKNTMKRIARGMQKFVFDNPNPFIVQVNHTGDNFRGQSVHKPLPTITQKHGFGKVAVVTAPIIDKAYGGNYAGSGSGVQEPMHTITTVDHNRLVSPVLMPYMMRNNTGAPGSDVTEPVLTITTGGHHGVIAPYLIQYHSETKNGEVRGQTVKEPVKMIDTITTSPGHFGEVSVYILGKEKFFEAVGGGNPAREDVERITERCTEVSRFLMEHCGKIGGEGIYKDCRKDEALITVFRNEYVIMDIFLRMLTPEELKRGQGFTEDYIIDRDINWKPYQKAEQVARIGNSVVPIVAKALVGANCPYLRIGERVQNMKVETEANGQLKVV